jgi:hypothetical protein
VRVSIRRRTRRRTPRTVGAAERTAPVARPARLGCASVPPARRYAMAPARTRRVTTSIAAPAGTPARPALSAAVASASARERGFPCAAPHAST